MRGRCWLWWKVAVLASGGVSITCRQLQPFVSYYGLPTVGLINALRFANPVVSLQTPLNSSHWTLAPIEAASFDSLYDGPEAQAIFSRSVSKWQSVLARARLLYAIPRGSLDLSQCLDRIPSLPDTIPRDARWIEGWSTWSNSDTLCSS